MLIEFTVKNYASFKDETTLSSETGSRLRKLKETNTFSYKNPALLKSLLLFGPNGSGKTTTIRMLLGIIKKDSGEITWNGKKVDRKSVNFGYLPEERGVYPKVKIYDQLMYFAELKGMKKEEACKEIDYWMKRLKVERV